MINFGIHCTFSQLGLVSEIVLNKIITLHADLNFSASATFSGLSFHVLPFLTNKAKALAPIDTASKTALLMPPAQQ